MKLHRHVLRFPLIVGGLFLGLTLLAVACNGDGGGEEEAPTTQDPPAGEEADELTLNISMGDNFFEANEFTVRPGQRVIFNITNDGAAIHNMRIAGEDGEYGNDDDTVSDPTLFNPGDSGTLVWTAPQEPGTILFWCDFHANDMVGTITVQ